MIRCLARTKRTLCPWQQSARRSLTTRRPSQKDPFRVLGIPRGSTYAIIKEAFIKLALEHHPDRSQNNKNDDSNVARFIQIRQAFEVLRKDTPQQEQDLDPDPELQEILREQTNRMFHFHMDAKTRQEVVDAVDAMQQSGLDGGTWFMARMLASQAKNRPREKAEEPMKLLSSSLRSRRKRR